FLLVLRAERDVELVIAERAADPAEPDRTLAGRDEIGARRVALERLEVGIAKRRHVDRAPDVVETPAQHALERHRERAERMRHARVAPVEEEIAAVPDEDLAVVEVVVLDRLRDSERGQPRAPLPNAR